MRLPRNSLFRYLTVGVANTCVGLGTIYLCLYALHLSDAVANAVGYCVGILFSFTLNKLWTFSARGGAGLQFAKFALVTGIAYVVQLATVLSAIRIFHANHYVAQALGVAPYTVVGYLGSRYFAFRNKVSRV